LFEHLPAQAGKLSGGLATHFSFGAGRFEFAVARRENLFLNDSSQLPQARNPVVKIQSWRDTGALKLCRGQKD